MTEQPQHNEQAQAANPFANMTAEQTQAIAEAIARVNVPALPSPEDDLRARRALDAERERVRTVAAEAREMRERQAQLEEPAEPNPTTEDGADDFDAFWQSRNRQGRRVKIMGQLVELPPALPLQFELEARRLAGSKDDTDVSRMLTILFGENAMEGWAERGMDSEQYAVLLAWAPRAVAGEPVTFAQVAAQIEAEMARRADSDDKGETNPPS